MSVPTKLAVALIAIVAILMLWMSSWSGENPLTNTSLGMISVLTTAVPIGLLWMAAALGFGFPLRMLLVRNLKHGLALQFALGIAALIFIDETLGSLGVLQFAAPLIAWMVVAVGAALVILQITRAKKCKTNCPLFDPIDFVFLAAAPALAVLFIAATSAPGWLWSSEFGGYDAMSYHLQLPKEWASIGRIEPLEHNVYSFLPGYGEAAYYHIRLLCGEGYGYVYAAQFVHAFITVGCGLVAMRLFSEFGVQRASASLGAVLMLGTPWVIVVGSLAYNELFFTLFFSAAWLIILIHSRQDVRNEHAARPPPVAGPMLACGLLIGAACAAKLTAIGFVAAPLLVVVIANHPGSLKRVALSCVWIAIGGITALLPYFIRNWLSCGNPVFPFLADLFGTAHWSIEQVALWNRGHSFDGSFSERITAVWNQLLRFGIGSPPDRFPDVWIPQWSVLFVMAFAGFFIGVAVRSVRRAALVCAAVLVVQLAFWMMFTHLKSRFMLPAVVPLAGLCAIGLCVVLAKLESRQFLHKMVCFSIGLVWCVTPILIFAHERGSAPAARIGLAHLFAGNVYDAALDIVARQFPAAYMNTQLSPSARVLMVGEAAPLYFGPHCDYQTTWDRGPLSLAMQESDVPAVWFSRLREQGYTHLYIDMTMLDLWERAGWGDPNLSPNRIVEAAGSHARLISRWGNGAQRLYALP